MKALGVLRKTPAAVIAVGIQILECHPVRARAALSMVELKVQVNLQPVGAKHGGASRELLATAVSGMHCPFLVLAADVVIVENAVAECCLADALFCLGYRRQPNVRKAGPRQGIRLVCQMVPPPVRRRPVFGIGITDRAARHTCPACKTPEEDTLGVIV